MMSDADTRAPSRDRAIALHKDHWGDEPHFVVRAPGRVNLIGEHTDYNDGFVFPMAIPFDTVLAVSPDPGETGSGDTDSGETVTIAIHSEGYGDVVIADPQPIDPGHWAAHIAGVHMLLNSQGLAKRSWRGTIATDIPVGASLSSSAALEVAVATAILELSGVEWTPLAVAQLGQRVENEVLGLPSGIMDQLISASAVESHASLIDCRSLEVSPQPLPSGLSVVILDTKTRRRLVGSEFADRRAACESAAAKLGVTALRDATLDDLARLGTDDDLERRRARHVITENQRTLDAAEAMSNNDGVTLGNLMSASHQSLRDDYEVSGDALDRIVEIAQSTDGCMGARMTGGGFAGCAVALVDSDKAGDFCAMVAKSYGDADLWLCHPAQGASISRLT